MLNITKNVENGKAVFKLEGRLDTVTSPDLETEFREIAESLTDLTFDFEGLEYVSSAGLRVLLAAQKVMSRQGTMRVIHVSEAIMDIFDVTGFSDILTIE